MADIGDKIREIWR